MVKNNKHDLGYWLSNVLQQSRQYTASEILTTRVYSFIILGKDSKKINVISIGGPEPFLKEGT